ncbi:MAG: hypothetical protein JNL82_39690 [Myxococcales bacterium]|nr:hypothetical protein [Myxococcales bacterium]
MLLKLYHLFRTNPNVAREFVERDHLDIDRRLDVVRGLELKDRFQFTEEEISIILREDDEKGKNLIRGQLAASFDESGLRGALGLPGMHIPERYLKNVVDDVIADIQAWLDVVNDSSWPGRSGPCAEHVSPAVVEQRLVDGSRELEFTIEGWLFTPEKADEDSYKLVVRFYSAGTETYYQATVKSVDDSKYPRSSAVVRVKLPSAAGHPIATYDVYVFQDDLTESPERPYPAGGSRLPAAITVCEFKAKFPQ